MPHLQHTHTQRTCVRLEYAKLTFLFSYFNLFWDFLMYFNIFGFVSAKKKNTRAINHQTVVVTSLKMASLDHSKLTRVPQIDISNCV